jgi:hypothetical protein
MGQLARDYEIRLHYADGTLSVVMIASAVSDRDAAAQARFMLRDGLANAHIWRDGELVDSVYLVH